MEEDIETTALGETGCEQRADYPFREIGLSATITAEQQRKYEAERLEQQAKYEAAEREERTLQRRHTALSLAVHLGTAKHADAYDVVAAAKKFDEFLVGPLSPAPSPSDEIPF